MPTARYTALNTRADRIGQDDMEAAFDYSENEDENVSESQPLTTDTSSIVREPSFRSHVPGTYDFENLDYDYPPPGSPPRPSTIALPNDYGNSNGFIPPSRIESRPGPRRNWFHRSGAAILPPNIAQWIGFVPQRPAGAIGGGTNNDGVFANVTAKPTRPLTIQEGDDTYIVPEESRAEAPPSYASAQADAVPPYWETTVHAPFTPGAAGEIIVDSLPTGSLFSFLWNMLVSISFQFVGFLLTYLLHTTHAARLGSRAGLGVTLIQYGFALRGRMDGPGNSADGDMSGWPGRWEGQPSRPSSSEERPAFGNNISNRSNSTAVANNSAEQQVNILVVDATTEWLSFFLMTVGWFILLTSLLGFWRVKRWERSILASQRDNSNAAPVTPSPFTSLSRMEHTFSLRGVSRIDLLRRGFGFGPTARLIQADNAARRAEEGNLTREDEEHALESEPMIPMDPNNPERSRRLAQALEQDRRLQRDLRNAGLL